MKLEGQDVASDFEFVGVANHKAEFRERSTGTYYSLLCAWPEDAQVELLEGDEVFIPAENRVYSLRENRVIRYNR